MSDLPSMGLPSMPSRAVRAVLASGKCTKPKPRLLPAPSSAMQAYSTWVPGGCGWVHAWCGCVCLSVAVRRGAAVPTLAMHV